MQLAGNTEENNKMKVSLIALTFGFFLVVGLPLAATAGPTPGGPDTDGDGDTVEDAFDNCTSVGNAGQEDEDHDGCGDACDPKCDCDGNGGVGPSDFVILGNEWGQTSGALQCDCDGNGGVGPSDFVIMGNEWGMLRGPSGITNPSRDYAECP
jgi:hypothetical protein